MSINMKSANASGNFRCRTCYGQSENFIPLDKQLSASSDRSLADMLLDIAKIDTKTENADSLPRHLCSSCSQKLQNAYLFAVQARSVNERLLANLRRAVGDLDPSKQGLDCLLEAPIDMPSECLQIKMEAEYDDGVSGHLIYDGVTDMELDFGSENKNAKNTGEHGNENIEQVASAVERMKKEELPCFSGSKEQVHLKVDPITIAETEWNAEDNDNDNSHTYEPHEESESQNSERTEPKKRKSLTIHQKAAILLRLESGIKIVKLSKELSVSHSTISRIWKNKETIRKRLESASITSKRIRCSHTSDIDKHLLEWYKTCRCQNVQITRPMIKKKANEIGQLLEKNFSCTNSWVYRFLKRNNIVLDAKKYLQN